MKQNAWAFLEDLNRERVAIVERERTMLAQISHAVGLLGYRLVPIDEKAITDKQAAGLSSYKKASGTLLCPTCHRQFIHPMHLGRHIKALHTLRIRIKRRKRAA